MRSILAMCGAVALAAAVAQPIHAQDPAFLKTTYLTFDAPVSLPGKTLPAGTYRFQLADPTDSRKVVSVYDKAGTKPYGMFLTIADKMQKPQSEPVIMFKETAAGNPVAVKAWFYPGESTGYEFVYSRTQAMNIAKANHTKVMSSEGDDVMKGHKYGRIDETGNVEGTVP